MSLKKLGTAILVAVALGSVLASSAFAKPTPNEVNWQKGESPYQTLVTQPLAVTTEQVGSATIAFTMNGTAFAAHATGVECIECQITNKAVGGSGSGRLKFTGVSVETPVNCVLPSTITTPSLSFYARYEEGGAELVEFIPTLGKNTAFITLEITKCGLASTWNVEGNLFGKFSKAPGVQAASQPVMFSPAINSAAEGTFHIANEIASLTATENFKAGGTYIGLAPGGVALPEATQTAAKWYTGATEAGVTELAGSQAVAAEQIGRSTLTATIGEQQYVITASGAECVECNISNTPTGGGGTGKLKLTGVTVEQPAGCSVSSTITTASLTLAANWLQGETALVRFTPTKGETTAFAIFEIVGCPQSTSIVPKGSLFGKLRNGQGHQATSQAVEFTPTINSNAGGNFHVSTEPATFRGEEVFKAGGLFFGVK